MNTQVHMTHEIPYYSIANWSRDNRHLSQDGAIQAGIRNLLRRQEQMPAYSCGSDAVKQIPEDLLGYVPHSIIRSLMNPDPSYSRRKICVAGVVSNGLEIERVQFTDDLIVAVNLTAYVSLVGVISEQDGPHETVIIPPVQCTLPTRYFTIRHMVECYDADPGGNDFQVYEVAGRYFLQQNRDAAISAAEAYLLRDLENCSEWIENGDRGQEELRPASRDPADYVLSVEDTEDGIRVSLTGPVQSRLISRSIPVSDWSQAHIAEVASTYCFPERHRYLP